MTLLNQFLQQMDLLALYIQFPAKEASTNSSLGQVARELEHT